jgi:opacity protein-like surface antigen
MKKLFGLAAGLMMTASLAFAADADPGQWLLQVEGGVGIPISSQAASQLSVGFSGEGQVGYAFSREFSLSVESGFDSLPIQSSKLPSGVSGSITHIPLEAVGQYNINTGGGVWPYIVVGVGVAFDSLGYSGYTVPSGVTTSWTNFELDPGIGVAFDLTKDINVFVQGKLAMDFETTSGTGTELTDSPLINIPVQAGFNFLL